METKTTIQQMMAENVIRVPDYQRAYSWDTPSTGSSRATHTDTFISDLEDYSNSHSSSGYYFGHFLFEKKDDGFAVVDGQQRLTTIVIFLSALFSCLKKVRALNQEEEKCFEDIIKKNSTVRLSTVRYDNQFFRDYVVDQSKQTGQGDTASARRIAGAFDYFKKHLSEQKEDYLVRMLKAISNASCTTHQVENDTEAVQMFIFQNDRGKQPSNLEVVKADFMYLAHLHGKEATAALIDEIKNRFEKIYSYISSIEANIDEDDVLLYTLRVYSNSLLIDNTREEIKRLLDREKNPCNFIKDFASNLEDSFYLIKQFFADEKKSLTIHSLVTLGSIAGIAVAWPFIIKTYSYSSISKTDSLRLYAALESLILRHRVVRTRAKLSSRLQEVFQKLKQENASIEPIIEQIDSLKRPEDGGNAYYHYWADAKLKDALNGEIDRPVVKYLLWKYEVYLESQQKNQGYEFSRFDYIEKPEMEHIAPQTEPNISRHGYGRYNPKFERESVECLGNYLLISKSHNCSVGNVPFRDKIATYTHNHQQRKVKEIGEKGKKWDREQIQNRKERIIEAVVEMDETPPWRN